MTDHTPIMRRDAVRSGLIEDEIRRALRTGALERLDAGVHLPREIAADLDDAGRHLVRVRAAAAKLGPEAVMSHTSAAVVHGFALWRPDLTLVHVSRNRPSGGRRTSQLHVHATPFAPSDVEIVDGIRVTSAARTIVDTARCLDADRAVVLGDSALRLRPAAHAALPAALTAADTRTGIAAARRMCAFLDGRSESPGESISRLRIRAAGLPGPVLQFEIWTAGGAFVARTDFFREEFGVVGEFDGMGKYRSADPGASAETVRREKLREDAIRAQGYEVMRWTWSELFHFDDVRARIDAATRRRWR
ncbi:hypothetical protein OCS65_08935 [Rhodococcus aetherivorans]|nr:hypothetical protein [Rhodococcus aetherivorans]ETT23317.1 protein of unknown function DUF4095 [Rhodococcus rhodochrous ATCC 21198]NGP27587.1 hypothetical protein [Rhodococcus aetherivorans]UGQ42676.1 hypothetical protein LRQ66_04980 [Rhodococcus aetherivorans]UYF95862.1 hypothetical protein OCS65_08935 [Rhodococcus aetherivorans]